MKTSAEGIAILTRREGVRLKAYKDSVGVWTIGVGHTGRASPPKVTSKMAITLAQAKEFLASDLVPFETVVNAVANGSKIPVTQNMFDAMVSLAFNIGAHGFVGSTVAHHLAIGDKPGAANAFLMWRRPAVLLSRRRAERRQFLGENQ